VPQFILLLLLAALLGTPL